MKIKIDGKEFFVKLLSPDDIGDISVKCIFDRWNDLEEIKEKRELRIKKLNNLDENKTNL
jgi:hypothetical protein